MWDQLMLVLPYDYHHNITYLVTLSLLLAPLQQSVSLGTSVLSGQRRQRILPLFSLTHIQKRYVSKHSPTVLEDLEEGM